MRFPWHLPYIHTKKSPLSTVTSQLSRSGAGLRYLARDRRRHVIWSPEQKDRQDSLSTWGAPTWLVRKRERVGQHLTPWRGITTTAWHLGACIITTTLLCLHTSTYYLNYLFESPRKILGSVCKVSMRSLFNIHYGHQRGGSLASGFPPL